MRSMAIGVLVLACGSGCAISEIKRVNQRLKEENDRLLTENMDLGAQKQRAEKEAEDRLLVIEDLKQQLASAERRGKDADKGTDDQSQIKPTGFKEIEDVDVVEERGQIRLILSEKVFFQSGSSSINAKGQSILTKVASVLKRDYGQASIRVDGHTDSTPIVRSKDKYASNWELSTDRACAVTRYLVDHGIESKRIFAAGFGENRPVASNATPAGREKNRRVEIVILKT